MLYRVLQHKKHPHIKRFFDLVVHEEEVFACQWLWLATLVRKFYKHSVVEYCPSQQENVYFGKELSEECCKIYEVKNTEDVWKRKTK